MMTMIDEVRLATRALIRRPGYSVAAVLTLALGIGANVAIFTVVNAILLRPLPYPEADRIVELRHHAPGLDLPILENSPGTFRFYTEEADFFTVLAAFDTQQRNLVGGDTPERVEVTAISPEMFEVLRVQPAAGRPFGAADAEPGATPVAILTHASWVSRFGADPAAIGQTIRLDGVVTEIVGVMAPGFAFPDDEAVALVPFHVEPDGPFGRFGTGNLARIPANLSVEQVQARATDLQPRLNDFFPNLGEGFLEQAGWSVSVARFQDVIVGERIASALWIVLATVGFVLLIACANVANLFLVRAEARRKELAVRAALGAASGRIAAGFLTESLVLGAVGGAFGVALAWLGVAALVSTGPDALPRLHEVRVDEVSLVFAGIVSVLTGLAFGAMPLLRYRGAGLAGVLNDGSRGSTEGRERHGTRNALVATQLALALVLLVGSGLMLRSFHELRSVDPGFDPRGVLTVGLSIGEGVDNRDGARFYQTVADEVGALPGVESVGLATFVPAGGGSSNGGSFYIESKPRVDGVLPPVAMYKAVGAEYVNALRLPLLQGRDLERADWEAGAPVALVNQEFADRLLGGSALGEGIKWDEDAEFARIVGVVADAKERGLQAEPEAWAYLPMVVGDWGYPGMERMSLLIRSEAGQAVPVPAVRQIVARLDPSVPLTSVRTMGEILAGDMAETSFTMTLLGIAAGVALLLGAIGLFGVVSYVVGQRTREIGVRVALGAHSGDIGAMVLRQGAVVVAVGVGIGLIASLALTRLMGTVLYGVESRDPLTFVGAPVILVCVAIAATWLPARKASRTDPVEALRAD